jgi:hypothetical protein
MAPEKYAPALKDPPDVSLSSQHGDEHDRDAVRCQKNQVNRPEMDNSTTTCRYQRLAEDVFV